jgi:hypothetical protein
MNNASPIRDAPAGVGSTRTPSHVKQNISSSMHFRFPRPFIDILSREFGDLTEKTNYY